MKTKIFSISCVFLLLCTSCAQNNIDGSITLSNQSMPILETVAVEIETTTVTDEIVETEKEKYQFLEKEGYIYWLEISDQDFVPFPVVYKMYRAKLDGSKQILLDETVFAYDGYWDKEIHGDADVFVFDDRIVFLGFAEVDLKDNLSAIKAANPTFVSIAFDGSERAAFERFEPNFQNPVKIGDYIYFGESNAVNRIRYDFEKYEKVLDINGFFITVHNDDIYYIDFDGLNVLSVSKNGGESTIVYTFPNPVIISRALNQDKTSWEVVSKNNALEITQWNLLAN